MTVNRKTGIRLAIIVPLLALLGWGAWFAANWLCAGQFDCAESLELGDLETAKWVVRWQPEKTNSRVWDELRFDCCWRGPRIEGSAAWMFHAGQFVTKMRWLNNEIGGQALAPYDNLNDA